MATRYLESGRAWVFDLSHAPGLSLTNVSDAAARIRVEYRRDGAWQPLDGGARTLLPRQTWTRTRGQIGHDLVKVVTEGRTEGGRIVRAES